jgi:acyl carrier protein
MNELEIKLKNVMSIVFELEPSKINDNSSPENLENWDSLRHMMLIGALEDEFEIQFTDDEMLELLNYKLIKLILTEKLDKS